MATAQGSHPIGPDSGSLVLRTTRQGLATKVGHDLTIEVTRWSGMVTVGADPGIDVAVETGSLQVVHGAGGVKPLSDRDKQEILTNAAKTLGSDRTPTARFVATSASLGADGGGTVTGTLTLRDVTRDLTLTITPLGDNRFRAAGTVVQTEFGIKPYSAFLGALKLADAVTVEAEVTLPG
ncbi:MAG TPA: YceI family protein [Pseudonocardiaceae bacterium]|jgi:polyisoprenoid-binding protein YceI|nr:YceI family protein [Pseudonocardiaceae bacterium]